jgi:hypothetical protein
MAGIVMKNHWKVFVCFFVCAFSFASARAQVLSVDINGQSSQQSQSTAPGFLPWNMGSQTGAGVLSVSQTFTNYTYTYDPTTGLPTSTNVNLIIPCTVAMINPTAANASNYLYAKNANKTGYTTSPNPNVGWRLSIDGAMSYLFNSSVTPNIDQPNTNGGAISLTISGLPAGVHSITTYHNDPWGPSGASWHAGITNLSRCIITANGVTVFTNTPSIFCTNDSKCGFAFFYVTNTYDGEPVVVDFNPDGSSPLDFTILNGFQIDRASAPGTTATAISPAPGDEHVFANDDAPLPGTASSGYLALQWQPATFAISNYLYFGTNSQAVANATTASNVFMGASAAVSGNTNSFNVSGLNSLLTYYWRVDQLDIDNGTTNLVQGAVWEFRPRHLAFPGAEGYGEWSRGGRGGVVMEVTNLNDSGPGSYRAAIEASGPRTIVFKVSGIIWLQSQCIVGNGYVTIAGQTAPGDGICIANWRAGCTGPNDVIMRYMHFRVGDLEQQTLDAMSPASSTQSIFDHLTSSWSLDVACNSLQNGAVGSQSAMTSYQHNIISEPLRYSYHYQDGNQGCSTCYQPHAFAASISGEIGSYHHNLIAHSTDRNWSMAGGYDESVHYAGSIDIRNNVVYNWNARTTDGGAARVDYENNYYKSYPGDRAALWLLRLDPINTNNGTPQYYMSGNTMEGENYFANNWAIGTSVPTGNGTNNYASAAEIALVITNAEIYPSYVTTQTASNAYKMVLSDVGCNEPAEDLIDRRVIGETLDGTYHYEGTNGPTYTINGVQQADKGPDNPGFIDSQTDVHDYQSTNSSLPNYSPSAPWPPYNTYNLADSVDSDHDGLPDWWENIRGTNPNSAPGDFSDANADLQSDGYTELDRYLNWLAQPHYDCANGTPLNVDLTQYTRGFTNASLAATYALFNATNGTIALNGRTAQFNSTVSTNALGSFMFKVTDNTGFSYTNTVNVHITTLPPNTVPTLATISNYTINVGTYLNVTNEATDTDSPAQTLTFTLPVAPTNAAIIATNGIVNWRPLVSQANTTNPFTVAVTDNGTPPLSATQNFSVIVNPLVAPGIVLPQLSGGIIGLTINGQVGPDYELQSSTDLVNWGAVWITNPATMPFTWSTNAGTLPDQYYRIQVGPPLP